MSASQVGLEIDATPRRCYKRGLSRYCFDDPRQAPRSKAHPMIRMRKLTDYGIVLLAHLARNPARATCNARCLASEAHLPVPTVSKILKALARAGLLVAHRGVKGGFSLARRPEEISMAQIISAMEGPIAITECSDDVPRICKLEPWCPVGTNWQKINRAVRQALENIKLSEMTCSLRGGFPPLVARGKILESRREQ